MTDIGQRNETSKGRQSSLPGPGAGTVRTPFVDLFVGDTRIPLQDAPTTHSSPGEGQSLDIESSQLFLVDFNYVIGSAVGVGNEVSLTILDPNWDVLIQYLATAISEQRDISFQFGWRGLDDRFGRSIKGLLVRDFTISYQPYQGAKVSLISVDKNVKLSQGRKNISFKSTDKISDVIKQVYAIIDPSIVVEIDPISQPIGEEFRWFNNLSPLEYIKELLKIAKSPKGTSRYVSITDVDDAGRTIVRIKADNPQPTATRQYYVGRDRMGEMFEFNPQVMGSLLLTLGGGRSDGISVDPETGTARRVSSTQDEVGQTLADKMVHKVPTTPSAIHEIPCSNVDSTFGVASGFRAQADNIMNNATAVVLGDPGLKPFQQVDIVVLKSGTPGSIQTLSDKSIDHTSGVYRLSSVEHVIAAGSFRTRLEMYRESSFIGNADAMRRLRVSVRPEETDHIVAVPSVISKVFG